MFHHDELYSTISRPVDRTAVTFVSQQLLPMQVSPLGGSQREFMESLLCSIAAWKCAAPHHVTGTWYHTEAW